MSAQQPDKNLVNRYLNGELSGIDLENFRERMQGDEQFKNEVNFQNLIRLGILVSKEEELKRKILEKIKFRKPAIPRALKLILTFLLITVIGISLWFYVGTNSSSHNKSYVFFPFISKAKEKKSEMKIAEAAEEKNKTAGTDSQQTEKKGRETATMEETPAGQNASAGLTGMKQDEQTAAPANDSMPQPVDDDANIVIKKDKLLISTDIPVIEKPTPDIKLADASRNPTPTQDAVEKLNPAAGIPEQEKAALNYLVEFWVSPINYRGYKMSKNKLIIYGIEEPDAVKLYRWNDAVFMKYGNEFFRLVNTFEYIPYQRLKESDVPLAIRQ